MISNICSRHLLYNLVILFLSFSGLKQETFARTYLIYFFQDKDEAQKILKSAIQRQ